MKTQLNLAALVLPFSTLNLQLSTLHAQDSLTPPGASAPTMKSLAQIEPRTVVNAANTPGDAGNLFIITNSLSYYLAANDFGVNQDGLGNLRGFAYGANIGWINFENTGAPKLDLKTGKFTGYVYSVNCGWISLSNAFAFMQTDTIAPGADTDGDSIADAWELQHFGNLTAANATSNADGDRATDLQEYLADTDPKDATSYLRITAYATAPIGTTNALTWTSALTRLYHVQESLNLGSDLARQHFGFDFSRRRDRDAEHHRYQCADPVLSRAGRRPSGPVNWNLRLETRPVRGHEKSAAKSAQKNFTRQAKSAGGVGWNDAKEATNGELRFAEVGFKPSQRAGLKPALRFMRGGCVRGLRGIY